jgi:serine/threonine protein kinase
MEPVPDELGRYRIIKELGRGGMGAVYLADDTELHRQVALKIPSIPQEDNPEMLERFYREARAAATLNHTNICQVYDIGEHEGTRFITMAYVSGPSLSELVGTPKLRSERTIARFVRKIAFGLAEAHSKGVLHRDLKPGNILLDERNEPVITDFGLARQVEQRVEDRLTKDGMLLGTPAYMSPEQLGIDPERMGPASDVFSLGVILYELLTGELPYQGPVTAVIGQIIDGKPKRPTERRPDLDKRLESICLKMMASSVDDRYPSAGDVIAALTHYLEQIAPPTRTTTAETAGAQRKLEEHKQQTIELLKEGKSEQVTVRLQRLAKVQGTAAEPYVKWANAELARLKAMPDEISEEGPTILAEAIKLLARQDYAGAIALLEVVPPEHRSAEVAQVLKQAQELKEEAHHLNERMNQAVRDRQYEGLREEVLKRLLEIEPGNLTARDIHERLGTYDPGEPLRFDQDGTLLPANAILQWLDRMARLVRERVTKGLERLKAATSQESKPKPTSSSGWDLQAIALAVGLTIGPFALLLGIVVLLLGGKETVKVEIDPAVINDATVTVLLDGDELKIASLGETIKLKPGDHLLEVKRGDVVVTTRDFRIVKGEKVPLRITLDGEDVQGLLELARRKRQLWVQKAVFGKDDDTYWEDCFGCYVPDERSIYAQFKTVDEIVDRMQAILSSVDEILLGPDSPFCEAQGPIGLIPWGNSMQLRRQGKLMPAATGLGIAVRRNGQWKEAVGIKGDWRLSLSDQYDPNDEAHREIQRYFDEVNRAHVEENIELVRSTHHPLYRAIGPDPANPEEVSIIDHNALLEMIEEYWKGKNVQEHQGKVLQIKRAGPIALVLASISHVDDNGRQPASKALHVFCQTADGWLCGLVVAGDWSSVLMAGWEQRASTENLKQIGLALHNYHDTFRQFPAAYSRDEQAKPLLSWRVHLLPFVEERALYDEFHLDEPWDSPHNRRLVARLPDVFRAPGSSAPAGKTNYLGVCGEEMIFIAPKSNDERPLGCRMRDIQDGTSNTLMVVEASDKAAVEWTRPADYEPDESQPLEGLVGLRPSGFLGVLADGAVHFIEADIDATILMRLFKKRDGLPIPRMFAQTVPSSHEVPSGTSHSNLKQLGIAIHNYYASFGGLPAAYSVDLHGKPLLSWRVHVLPFVDQRALYEEFDLDEPWDSPHNRRLVAKMPNVFRSPESNVSLGKTTYLAVRGEEMVFVEPRERRVRCPTGCRFRDITDGTSNTLMVVEVSGEAAVEWTRPADFEPDEAQPLKDLAGLSSGEFRGLCGDGSVHSIPSDIDPTKLMRLFTKNDGQPATID